MARVVFTAAADADAASILADLYAKAGKPTVLKYRASFKTLYEHLAAFPDSGSPRPKLGRPFASASFTRRSSFTGMPRSTAS
jgi:plasmid stabilization system protein ParE